MLTLNKTDNLLIDLIKPSDAIKPRRIKSDRDRLFARHTFGKGRDKGKVMPIFQFNMINIANMI